MSRIKQLRQLQSEPGIALSPLPDAGVVVNVSRWPLALLLLLYIVAASIHAWLVPIDQTGYQNAPDEAAHVNYVRVLATGHLPTLQDAERDSRGQSYEWHQPPLYYAVATSALWAGPKGIRIVSILIGVMAIFLIFTTVRILFPGDPGLAVLAAGIAALLPSHVAITSTVNNDGLLEVCCTAALLALVIILRNGLSLWRAGWLGFAVGAAMLTKATGMLLLPVVLLSIPLLRKSGETPANLMRGFCWSCVVIGIVCGWWYVRNGLLYHEVLPLKAFEASFSGTAQASAMADGLGGWGNYWRLAGTMSFMSFWAVYGTPRYARVGMPAFLPDTIYLLMGAVTLIALIGMIRLHFKQKELAEAQRYAIWLMSAFFALVFVAFVSFLRHYFQTQGRYLYPAMLPICLLLALGWRFMFPANVAARTTANPNSVRDTASVLLLALFGLVTALYLSTVQAAVM